jgi:hypothetical protein
VAAASPVVVVAVAVVLEMMGLSGHCLVLRQFEWCDDSLNWF